MNNPANYYDESLKTYCEEATLAEEIVLPTVSILPKGLTLSYFENNNYITPFDVYENTIGKFYIPILSPLVETDEASLKSTKAPSSRQIQNVSGIGADKYGSQNYIQLIIPKYILLNYAGSIPVGTKFIICFIGGKIDIGNIKIIGISTLSAN